MSSESREGGLESRREDLLDRTRTDPALGPAERETTIRFAADEDVAHIHTEEASLIRRFLSHDGVSVDALGVYDGERRETLTLEETLLETEPEDLVVRLKGRVPVRYVTVGSTGRDHDQHAPVVPKRVFDE